MKFPQILRSKRKELGLTQQAIADIWGIKSVNVSDWENGKGMPEAAKLQALAKRLGITLSELMGETPIQQKAEFDTNVKSVFLGQRAIPVISAIQAGAFREITDPYEAGDGKATIYVDARCSRWVFGLEIEGDSMLPDYRPGDIVIIDPERAPRPGDCVAAKNGREEATFKKYRQRGIDASGKEVFELVPLNPDYPTIRSDETPLYVIGVMIESRRKVY